jgi:energy-coupling factor transporter ATP-binding protein EcfA2
MKRAEIRRRLDEIIAFSGLERFIDTPVKSYSSGMYVRLGFAVMAHLEAEVLLIDEVLAVGDTAFRIKSMNKIREMVSGGTTCMIVTHDLYQISALCNRALVLDQGRCVYLGGAEQAVSRYLDLIQTQSTGADDLRFEQGFRFESVTLNETSEVDGFPVVTSGRDLEIRVDYRLEERIPEGIQIGVLIKNGQGHRVTGFTTLGLGERLSGIPGRYSVRVKIRRNPLLQGFYSVSLSAFDQGYRRQLAGWQNVVRFGVETPGFHSLHQVGDMLPDVEILS